MAKKKVDEGMAAYKSKGMKNPRPAAYGAMDQSAAPKSKPSMQHKEPAGPFQYPRNDEQRMQLDHKKKAMPHKDAPEGVSDMNGGSEYALPKSGGGLELFS
jgi:hypothetical protein